MNFKKVALSVLVCFFLFSAFSQKSGIYSLLWKIEGNGIKKPSYLFGTMHIRDARAFNFSDSVMRSIEKCSAFALEVHPDTMMTDLLKGLGDEKKGKDLSKILSKEDYERVSKEFEEEYGYPMDKLNTKNPYMIRTMLAKADVKGVQKQTFLDAYLLGIAKTLGKEICGLEKTSDQLEFLNGFSDDFIREEFSELLETNDKANSGALEKLTKIYATGDAQAIYREFSVTKFNDSVMIKRNKVMANSINALIKSRGSLFAAIGAAHLEGKDGVLQLLRNKGYKVSVEQASFTGVSKKYSIDPGKMKWVQFTDSANGFTIESPGQLIDFKMYEGLDTKICFDLTNSLTYGFYAINMSNTGAFDEKSFLNTVIENYKKSDKSASVKVKETSYNGIDIKEIVMKSTSRSYMRLQLFVKNKIFYGLFVGGEVEKIKLKEADRYFNSFNALNVQKTKDSKWIKYKNGPGAFSVDLPTEPKISKKDYNNPQNESELYYSLHIFFSVNLKSLTNYVVRYNDYPDQMYVQKKQSIFDAFFDEFSRAGKMVSGPDTVWHQGIEGRKFASLLQDQYYTEGRIFIRGNRTYVLLKQSGAINTNSVVSDGFFDSFTFESYQKPDFQNIASDKDNFEALMPGVPKVSKDTTDNQGSIINPVDYFVTNSLTGGLYQFEYYTFNSFFRAKNTSDYYKKFVEASKTENDSILSSDSVNFNGIHAHEFVIKKENEDNPRRVRFWLYGNRFFFTTIYVGKEELFSENSNVFFNSFKPKGAPVYFDMKASKTGKILEGLVSKDSIILSKAKDAFNYYEFESADSPLLIEALKKNYGDDTVNGGIKTLIVEALAGLKDTSAIKQLTELYKEQKSSSLRTSILKAITDIDLVKGLSVYLDLLEKYPLKPEPADEWKMFAPLGDSLNLTRSKFDQVIRLIKNDDYRGQLLSKAILVAKQDTTGQFIGKYYTALTEKSSDDLKKYLENLKDTTKYMSGLRVINYLDLFELKQDKAAADNFTTLFIGNQNVEDYYKVSAVETRVKCGLETDPKVLEKLMKEPYYRYSILSAYSEANKLGELKSKYTNEQEIAKTVLYYFLSEDADAEPVKMKQLGEIRKENEKYTAFSVIFEGDENEYLAVCGPFKLKEKKQKISELYGYSSYKTGTANWKALAKEMISDLLKYWK